MITPEALIVSDHGMGAPDPATRAPRVSVMLSATVERFGGGPQTRHRVRDLSSGGIRIDQAERLTSGATVLITVGALEAVGATVRWVRDGSAGLAFAHEIDPEQARTKAAIAPARAAKPPVISASPKPSARRVGAMRNPYCK